MSHNMTPQQLKNSVLQLAIQGRLVKQRPEEGTGAELYKKIQAEKKRLGKEGKLKKEKPLPEISKDEIPFDIPESWVWVRLGNVISLLSGTDFKPEEYNDRALGTPYITGASSLSDKGVIVNRWTQNPRCIAESGDILLVCKGSGYGKTVFCDVEKAHIARQIMAVKRTQRLDLLYVMFFLNANLKGIKANGQGVIPGIDRNSVLSMVFPLPPLAEQYRIVEKIESLLPLINRYAEAWERLEAFNTRFPLDMQKSLLQMAIQGKLVEQRAEEGTGEELYREIQEEKAKLVKEGKLRKEKPLPEIAENEIPFDIPESWKWVRVATILNKLVDGTHRTPKYTFTGVPFVSVRNMSNGILSLEDTKYISVEEHLELSKRCNPQKGDILLSKVGTTGVPAKVDTDEEFSLFVSVALLKFDHTFLDIDFLIHAILNPDFQKQCKEHTRGVGNKNWVIQDIANTIFPLPPLAEQKRIVAKLNEMLSLCDALKG